ncbi:protein of unknown function [Candidatus Hydrogenisulfobacillus filiaventi]|uniref:Uncharacterized protein n=1 Tax=Candidatus Hydrogenisulfobacillus filiaventi TaxID=2707344 RepID=A0A6F8ZDM8_9FIRM|nr:protein of unknown function [Candidatus Hydrogenisulfobacillus filiaventi]
MSPPNWANSWPWPAALGWGWSWPIRTWPSWRNPCAAACWPTPASVWPWAAWPRRTSPACGHWPPPFLCLTACATCPGGRPGPASPAGAASGRRCRSASGTCRYERPAARPAGLAVAPGRLSAGPGGGGPGPARSAGCGRRPLGGRSPPPPAPCLPGGPDLPVPGTGPLELEPDPPRAGRPRPRRPRPPAALRRRSLAGGRHRQRKPPAMAGQTGTLSPVGPRSPGGGRGGSPARGPAGRLAGGGSGPGPLAGRGLPPGGPGPHLTGLAGRARPAGPAPPPAAPISCYWDHGPLSLTEALHRLKAGQVVTGVEIRHGGRRLMLGFGRGAGIPAAKGNNSYNMTTPDRDR